MDFEIRPIGLDKDGKTERYCLEIGEVSHIITRETNPKVAKIKDRKRKKDHD